MSTVRIKMDPQDPDFNKIRELALEARRGKIIAFPTETVYGMGAPMSIRGLSSELSQLKGRKEEKPFSIHLGDWDTLRFLNIEDNPVFRYLSKRFWPGPVTFIVKDKDGCSVGLRFPDDKVCAGLINACGEPFIATSANVGDAPSSKSAKEVLKTFDGKIDYLIDTGDTTVGIDSTVVDLTGTEPVLVREGALGEELKTELEKVKQGDFPRKHVLIVCTGNSCRSPMAEGYLKLRLEQENLGTQITVSSCGIGAYAGSKATKEAVEVLQKRGSDISAHRSRSLLRQDVLDSDMIIVMGREHHSFISGLVPEARKKLHLLNVVDPIGMAYSFYESVFEDIERKIEKLWNEIIK